MVFESIRLKKRFFYKERYKLILILICLLSGFLMWYQWTLITEKITEPVAEEFDARKCFSDSYLGDELEIYKLEDILSSKRKPTLGNTIFFHETSCPKTNELQLNARQACAIESAARQNPNSDIFVLFTSPTANRSNKLSEIQFNIQKSISSYPNIYLRNVNLWKYAKDTPAYEWLEDGQLFNSKCVSAHTADFLRLLTLWRWGGTHLDLDLIVKNSLENLQPNYAGAESDYSINNAIINLDNNEFGHNIADILLRNFQLKFDGYQWFNNCPGDIKRVLRKICHTKDPKLMARSRCSGFNVYPRKTFYAIAFWNWKYFFQEQYLDKVLNVTDNSIAIHFWNHLSRYEKVKVGSNVAYDFLAKNYCPKVYSSCGEYF